MAPNWHNFMIGRPQTLMMPKKFNNAVLVREIYSLSPFPANYSNASQMANSPFLQVCYVA